jgi:hypothetical protein
MSLKRKELPTGFDHYIPQSDVIQQLAGQIRTDLDEFSLIEICSLIRHGYEVALKQIRAFDSSLTDALRRDPCISPYPAVYWPPSRMTREQIADFIKKTRSEATSQVSKTSLREGERRIRDVLIRSKHLRVRLWDPRDWASVVLPAYMMIPLVVLLWLSIDSA